MASYTSTKTGSMGFSGIVGNLIRVVAGSIVSYGFLSNIRIDRAFHASNALSLSGSVSYVDWHAQGPAVHRNYLRRRRWIWFDEEKEDFSDVRGKDPEKMTMREFEKWRRMNG